MTPIAGCNMLIISYWKSIKEIFSHLQGSDIAAPQAIRPTPKPLISVILREIECGERRSGPLEIYTGCRLTPKPNNNGVKFHL